MNDRDARLRQFFISYFNQDWDIGGAKSWTDVVAQYVKENPETQVIMIQRDLRSWLEDTASTPAGGLPAAFGCDYDPQPNGLGEREWVRLLADFLGKQLTS
jgi:CdiI immunity protein